MAGGLDQESPRANRAAARTRVPLGARDEPDRADQQRDLDAQDQAAANPARVAMDRLAELRARDVASRADSARVKTVARIRTPLTVNPD